jgi:hypothetical protein
LVDHGNLRLIRRSDGLERCNSKLIVGNKILVAKIFELLGMAVAFDEAG